MITFLLLLLFIAVFVLAAIILLPSNVGRAASVDKLSAQYLPVSAKAFGKSASPLVEEAMKRAGQTDTSANATALANGRYKRQLLQANWWWEQGEPMKPSPKARFWNLETLWGEKMMGAALYGGGAALALLAVLFCLTLAGIELPPLMTIAIPILAGILGAMMGYSDPDARLAAAAHNRQRALSLEMGLRITELVSDVLSGATIQRAMRDLASRPGGPFIEELRRVAALLAVDRNEIASMDLLIYRNAGNELVAEFANSVKLVAQSGGQITPALRQLADAAQAKTRQQIQSQGRKNAQEMARPTALSSTLVMTLLVVLPAVASILGSVGQ